MRSHRGGTWRHGCARPGYARRSWLGHIGCLGLKQVTEFAELVRQVRDLTLKNIFPTRWVPRGLGACGRMNHRLCLTAGLCGRSRCSSSTARSRPKLSWDLGLRRSFRSGRHAPPLRGGRRGGRSPRLSPRSCRSHGPIGSPHPAEGRLRGVGIHITDEKETIHKDLVKSSRKVGRKTVRRWWKKNKYMDKI